MPKYRVKVQPLGALNGKDWPEVGETVEFDAEIAKGMVDAGMLEEVKPEKKVETRPASATATAKKAEKRG
jgi:hypothetical protein